ncbi:MAG: hypothetical protein ACO3NW_01760 [Kiritimatiellia bacterium]
MNHYINLLENSEITYHSPASVPPALKLVGLGAVILVLGMMGMRFQSLRAKAAEGDRIKSTWDRIEKDVEAAKALNTKSIRLQRGLDTLQGWSHSGHPWPEILDFLVEQSPVEPENIQFTRFFFDEKMDGLRDQTPGGGDGKYFPVKRQVTITLRGILRSERPQRILPEYRRNLAEAKNPPSPIEDVGLDNPVIMLDAEGQPSGLTGFTYSIRLKDREVKP